MKVVAIALLFALAVCAEVYFSEKFDAGWEDRWVKSKFKNEEERGTFVWSAGKHYSDPEEDKGLKTGVDARFYQISAKIPKEFSNEGKDLIVQYSVKHEQNIDCGGGYIKLLPAGLNQDQFQGDSDYNIMFGPDICGSSTKKVHLIFNYKGKNHLLKKDVRCESDELTHLYTMILHPDNTYEIQIDQKEVAKGSLKEDWDMLPPKKIKDPSKSKPADWVDERMIPDPQDKKPEGWDTIPKEIKDPEAVKPDDWDSELDGEWEAPMIDNPEYKGEWKPKMIDNPAYKGEWEHPMIDNPDYYDDNTLYRYKSNAFVGFEIWQVKAGTIFDNILVTSSLEEAKKWAEKTKKTQEGEKAMKDAEDKKKKEEEEANKKTEEEEEVHPPHEEHKDEL